jgi:hypothetical protein
MQLFRSQKCRALGNRILCRARNTCSRRRRDRVSVQSHTCVRSQSHTRVKSICPSAAVWSMPLCGHRGFCSQINYLRKKKVSMGHLAAYATLSLTSTTNKEQPYMPQRSSTHGPPIFHTPLARLISRSFTLTSRVCSPDGDTGHRHVHTPAPALPTYTAHLPLLLLLRLPDP